MPSPGQTNYKIDLQAICKDYGFAVHLMVAVSVTDSADGSPITDLSETNFRARAVQGRGRFGDHPLEISKLREQTPGVYVLEVRDYEGGDLVPGKYTIVVSVTIQKDIVGSRYYGQSIAAGTLYPPEYTFFDRV